MRVIATAKGYDNLTTREPGDEFDMPEGSKGSWFTAIDGDEPGEPKKPKGSKSGRAANVAELAKDQADLA